MENLLELERSPAKLASNTDLNMIQFHLENKSKIKWFFKKYPIKDDLSQILINIYTESRRHGAEFREKKDFVFFLVVYSDQS